MNRTLGSQRAVSDPARTLVLCRRGSAVARAADTGGAMSDVPFLGTSPPHGLVRQGQKSAGPWRVIYLTLTIVALSAFGAMGLTLMAVVARLTSVMRIFGE